MSWECPDCGKKLEIKGSHVVFCKGKRVRSNPIKPVLVRTEEEIKKDPYAKVEIQPAERLPHDGCPYCGCVDTLQKSGPYLEPVQNYTCKICGKGHQWNEIDDVPI